MVVRNYESAKDFVTKNGGGDILVDEEYINSKVDMTFICHICNKNYTMSWNEFQQGHRHSECVWKINGLNKRHSYEYIKDFVEKNGNGDVLISKEYQGTFFKLNFLCHKCNKEYSTNWNHFRQGARHEECSFKEMGLKSRISYNYVKESLEKRDCKLISDTYVGIFEPLEILFSCGHIDKRSFHSFKTSKNICPSCAGTKKHEYEEIYNIVSEYGYKLLSKEYLSNSQILELVDLDGYKYSTCFENFRTTVINAKSNLNKFDKSNIYTMFNVSKFLEINIPFLHLYDGQKWIRNDKKINFYDDNGYKYNIKFSTLQCKSGNGYEPCAFHTSNSFSLENIEHWLLLNNKSFSLVKNQKYLGIDRRLKFKCNICNMDEIPFLSSFVSILQGAGCSLCTCRQIGKYNNLLYLYPEIAKEWDYEKNYPLRPENIAPHANKKIYWICPNGHSYYSYVNGRTGALIGCKICSSSKGESAIKKFLDFNHINHDPEHRFDDCKYKKALPFDFYLMDYNICCEYQGIQHYGPYEFFGGEKGFEIQKIKDKIKKDYCKKNNIRLIEIPYWEYDNIEIILNELLFPKKKGGKFNWQKQNQVIQQMEMAIF